MRWLLIITLLLWPACLTPKACAAVMPASSAKKMTGDCCKKGCDCAANTKAPAKQSPAVIATPDIQKIAAAPLPLLTLTAALATFARCERSANFSQAISNARTQSILCLWTT